MMVIIFKMRFLFFYVEFIEIEKKKFIEKNFIGKIEIIKKV